MSFFLIPVKVNQSKCDINFGTGPPCSISSPAVPWHTSGKRERAYPQPPVENLQGFRTIFGRYRDTCKCLLLCHNNMTTGAKRRVLSPSHDFEIKFYWHLPSEKHLRNCSLLTLASCRCGAFGTILVHHAGPSRTETDGSTGSTGSRSNDTQLMAISEVCKNELSSQKGPSEFVPCF
jgi:hypothetical protein